MTTNLPALPDESPNLTPTAADSFAIDPLESEEETTHANVAGATGVLALGNIFSRVLGLVRDQLLTFLFGASAAMDAFQVAVLVPKNFYDLLIGGHINGAVVPVLSEIVTVEGRDELWKVVNILLSLLTTITLGLLLLIQVFAPQIVRLTVDGYDVQTQQLATDLLRITSPALLFLGLFAIFSGTLYALKQFTWPAFAGVIFNGSIVVTTVLLAPPLQILIKPDASAVLPISIGRPQSGITAAAVGWFVGAVVQMALQLPGLRATKMRFTFNWRHPALKRIALLYAPVMFSLVMDILVIRFFSYNLASQTGIEGSITYMNIATTLIQFPQGLVATAISIAILPTLASQATLIKEQGLQAFRSTLGLGLRLATTLIIPAAAGLFVLATPIITLLFQRGEFTALDTTITATALRFYLIGLPFAAIDLLLVYAFYARKDTLTPALIGVVSHVIYVLSVLLLFERFSLFSLMLADSVKHITHATISAVFLRRHLNGFGQQRLLITALKTFTAAGGMVIVGWYTLPFLISWIGLQGLLRQLLLVGLSAGLSGIIFFALAAVLRIEELYWILRLIRKRLKR